MFQYLFYTKYTVPSLYCRNVVLLASRIVMYLVLPGIYCRCRPFVS